MSALVQDLRYSLRQLRKSPAFAISAVLTLAMAIGANVVVFSVLYGLILRPLNVPQPETLYSLQHTIHKDYNESYPDYLDLRDRNRSFENLVAYTVTQVGLDTGKAPTPTWGLETSGNYFDALHIQPYFGRFFHASDENGPNSAPYMVLGYAYWHSHFHDDREVLGRVVQVNKHPFTIIGVTPPRFRGTLVILSPDFFVPIVDCGLVEGTDYLNNRANPSVMQIMGHLKAGVTSAQATTDLNSIAADLEKTYPKDDGQVSRSLARPNFFGDSFGGPIAAFITGLMMLAGLILLAGCANLGSLFAARAADRSREVALRLALGSSRKRILRSLFSEALVVSLIGGAVGLWAGSALLRWLSQWQPFGNFPVHAPVNPDATVYTVALLLSLVSGFLFGGVPVTQVLRTNPYEIVKAGSTATTGPHISARDVLLAVQIALCAVLVTSSLVALRGLSRSLHAHFGFDPQNTLLVSADLHMAGYTSGQVPPMQKRMLDAIAGIPGIEAVGLSYPLLLNDTESSNIFTDQTTDLRPANAAANVYTFHVSPDYLRAEGTTLLGGRDFTWHDDRNATRVALVNREFARKIFGSAEKAIGAYFKMPDGTRVQVVGITENGKYNSLTEDPHEAVFLPILQSPASSVYLVVRSNRDPQIVGPAIRNTLHRLDAAVPVDLETRYDEMVGVLFPAQMATIILGVMGGIGALLAITGIFGMAAHSVSKRLRELGIRVALGAQREEVLKAALGRSFRLLAFGSAVGLLLGILASRVLALIVFEATSRDPLVLAGVVVAMALLGLIATWIPARRALSIDPMVLLREE